MLVFWYPVVYEPVDIDAMVALCPRNMVWKTIRHLDISLSSLVSFAYFEDEFAREDI